MTNQVHHLRFEKGDGVYNATIKNCSLPAARRAFIRKLREMGVLNVDPGQIRKGHKIEGTIELPVPAEEQPVPPSDLSNFEQGFQLFNQLRDGSLTHGSRAVESRRWYKAIQLMASEDYNLMEQLVNNPWLIQCALKDWKPCEDGIRWAKIEH